MSVRFATQLSVIAVSLLLIASAHAQYTFSYTGDCSKEADRYTGVDYTVTITLDRSVMHVGDTANLTYNSNAYSVCGHACLNNPACGDGLLTWDGALGIDNLDAPTNGSGTCDGSLCACSHTYSWTNTNEIAEACEDSSTGTYQFTVLDGWSVAPYDLRFCVYTPSIGGPLCSTLPPISVLADNTPDLGGSQSKSGCEGTCGSPINLTNGNVYIEQQDYSLPGLGGGIHLVRTWNSLWVNNIPWESSGLFGDSWQSNYEEYIQVLSSGAKYWRGDGSGWTFTYDPNTQTYTLTSPPDERATLTFNSSTTQFTLTLADGTKRIFSQPGYLLAIIDRNGNQTTLSYDGSNRLTTVTDAASRVLTFNHGYPSFPGVVTSIQDAVGTIATYAYDGAGYLSSVTYADGSVVNFNSDANGLITSTTDAQGKVLEAHTYDSARRGLTSQAANGVDSVAVSYNSSVATLTDSGGNATQYTAGKIANRNFVTSVFGSGCDTCGGRRNYTFTYDSSGNRTSSTDPMGHVTNYSYDGNGNVTQKSIQMDSVPNYQTWRYTYNSFNEVLTATDPLGNVTTNTYDTKGNLLTTTSPSPGGKTKGSVTSFTYDTKGELTKITDPLNHSTTIAYYPTGLIKTITDAQSKVTQFQYDARGNRTAVIDANNQQTTFTYDAMNRLTKITYPTSPATFTQIGYDYRGRKSSVTDPNGKITQYGYDDADRLILVTDANSGLTQYAYDNENNLTSIIDAAGHQTTFQYDQYGSVTQAAFPSSLTETYSYDLNGNLLAKTDRNGHTVNYGYDFLNRLGSKQYPDSTSVTYTYDGANRLTRIVDPSGTYGFTYDNMSRLTQTSAAYSFISGKTFTVGYGYDAASNRTSMADPQNASTAYVYDTLNRLTTLTYPSRTNYAFTYDVLGRRTQLTRPNSVTTGYQYDAVSNLLSILHTKSGTTLDGATYAYDAAGNRTSKTDKRTNVTSTFSYDPLYELTQVLQGSNTTESYSYDAVGNRLSSLGVSPYSYNTSNELTSKPAVTYTYDNNGNTLTKVDSTGTTTYSWDFENRLTSVLLPGSGGTVSFKYDPFGRRIRRSSSLGTTDYVYDRANLIEEVDDSGNVLARYTDALGVDETLTELRSGTTSYFEQDGIGSTTSLSNGSGTLANTYTYDTFGRLIASTGTLANPFQYTGRELDPETGLYYYRARYYDPSIGRFISEDPIGFAGGIDRFAYVGNNPTNYKDSYGLCRVVAYFRQLGSIAGVDWSHAYMLTTDANGTTYFGAFPNGNGPLSSSGQLGAGTSGSSSHASGRSCSSRSSRDSRPGGWGQLVPQYGPYTPDVAGNDYTTGSPPSMVVLDNGSPCGTYDAALTDAMDRIRDANISYDPFLNNSNAAAGTALRNSGLSPGQPPVWAPGWGNNLLPTQTTAGGSAF